MRWPILLLFMASLWVSSSAQPQYKDGRILIVLDGCENMLQRWNDGDAKFKVAEKIIINLMDSVYRINDQVEFALHVYGHQYPASQNNCYDNKLEVAFSKNNFTQMELRLASLKPKGSEAMKSAVQNAVENDLLAAHLYNYTFIVITSGEDNCEEGICTLSQAIQNKDLKGSPTVINLSERQIQYGCVGEQVVVKDVDDIPATISHLLLKYKSLIEPRDKSYKSAYGSIRAKTSRTTIPDAPEKVVRMQVHSYGFMPTIIYPPNIAKVKVQESVEPNNEFGYLKIVENVAGNDFELYHQQGTSFTLFDELKRHFLTTGQQILLKAGNYKLVYMVQTRSGTLQKIKLIIIKKKMITEIKLD